MKHGSLVQRESGDPMSLTFFRNKPIERTGEWQFTEAMLDRQLPSRHGTEISLAGFAKIWLAVGDKSFAPATIHKNVQVSRRHFTRGSLQTCEAVLLEGARRMNVERKIAFCLNR